MGRVRNYATVICCVALACLFGLLTLDEESPNRLAETWGRIRRSFGQDFKVAEGIKLYRSPDDRPTPSPGPETDFGCPEIFKARSTIIIFGATWCQWCKGQGIELSEPSKTYNVIYVDVDEKRWGDLAERWQLGSSIPVVVIFEGGEVKKTFTGFTKWEVIKEFAEKAKKNEDESKADFVIGPLDRRQFGDVNLPDRNRMRF